MVTERTRVFVSPCSLFLGGAKTAKTPTRDNNACSPDPRQPGEFSKCLNTGQTESYYGSDSDEYRSASRVTGHGVESDGDSQHA